MLNSSGNNSRKEVIDKLQELASDVLKLKNTQRQKRPIVIEFSGSPKSGKTSCINSLELFLKRNGFRVEIIHERANICPVYDKHSPKFNIWTACSSVAGMLGVLDRKEINCDVLILDRGIFDACCWFNWLLSKGMMEDEQKVAIETFLLHDDLVNRIEIVFAFYATPEVSIKREYANLLTDKLGSIMNINVLEEYLTSIKKTKEEKQEYFHNIFLVDTSDKSQDDVGKEVTDTTLNTLRNALMEQIGYFSVSEELNIILNKKRTFKYTELKQSLGEIQFGLRGDVEKEDFLQPIPIVVITNKKRDKVLVVKKNTGAVSDDSPEKNKTLIYVGGHTRKEDVTGRSDDFLDICRYTLRREVKEEIGISLAFSTIEPFCIYTPDEEKSKKHLAICFLLERDIETLKLRLDPEELILNKGKSKSGKFHDVVNLFDSSTETEPWSIEIMKNCFNIQIPDSSQDKWEDFLK